MNRAFVFLLLFFALAGGRIWAQGPQAANDNLNAAVAESFNHGSYSLKIAATDIIVVKFVDYDTYDPRRTNQGPIYCTQWAFLANEKAVMRQDLAALPPQNLADGMLKMVIPKGTPYYSGTCAGGVMVQYGGTTEFLPYHRYQGDQGRLQQDIEAIRRQHPDAVFAKRPGGIPQVYVPEGEAAKAVKVLRHERIDPPNGPSNGGGALPPPQINIEASPSPAPIQNIIQEYKVFPGGIISQPKGSASINATSARYDADGRRFLVNDQLAFYPELGEEELWNVYQAVFLSADGHFAAVSQDEMQGMPHDGMAAFILGQADRALGAIAYGYDTDGFAPAPGVALEGYANPLVQQLNKLATLNDTLILNELYRDFYGLQPRLFMNFQSVRFATQGNTLYPTAVDMKIQYQVFFTADNREYEFANGRPEDYFPHFVNAVKHLERRYAEYEAVQPFFYQTRKLAECYAFFQWLKSSRVQIADMAPLQTAFNERQPIEVVLNNYNEVYEGSHLFAYWQKSLYFLERFDISRANAIQKLAYYNQLHTLSLNVYDWDRAIKYRNECLAHAPAAYPSGKRRKGFYPDLQEYYYALNYRTSANYNGQVKLARSSYGKDEAVHQRNLGQAIQWLQQAASRMPSYAVYDQLAYLYGQYLDQATAASYLSQYYDLAEAAAAEGDAHAQYLIGSAYYNGSSRAQNQEKGMQLLLASAKSDNKYAQNMCGVILVNGSPNDAGQRQEGIAFIRQAAEKGFAQAQYNLGYLYENGQADGRPNISQAKYWYGKAAAAGHEEAKAALANLS